MELLRVETMKNGTDKAFTYKEGNNKGYKVGFELNGVFFLIDPMTRVALPCEIEEIRKAFLVWYGEA